MPRRERLTVAVLAAVILVSLAQFTVSELRFPVKQGKGLFVEGIAGRIKTLNPIFVDFNDVDRDISQLIFSGLFRYDPLKKNFFPDLATSWERSKDGRTYTVNLRTDALWHDNKPVTADDVIFTFRDVIQDPGLRSPIIKNAFSGINVEQTGTTTIAFTLPKSNSYFISNLTIGILPKHLLLNTAIAGLEKSSFNQRPVGSGPYKLSSLKLDEDGDTLDLEMFKEYYGEKPEIEQIRFYTFPDEKSLLDEQEAVHSMAKLSMEAAKSIKPDSRFALYKYTLNQFTGLFFNTEKPFLKDKKMRQALLYALNKKEIIKEGEERVDTIDLADKSADPMFSWNPDLAAKTLDQAGWKLGPDGFRINNKGEKISLNLLAFSKNPKEQAETIRNQWQTLGLQIQIERLNAEDFSRFASERRYDALLISQNLGYNRDFYPLLHSSQIADPSKNKNGLNFSQFKSFRTDGLTEAIRKEKDPSDKEKLMNELSKTAAEEVPFILISTPVYSYAVDKKFQQFPPANLDFHSDRFRILPYLKFL